MYSQSVVQPDYSQNFDGAAGRDGSDAAQVFGGTACGMRTAYSSEREDTVSGDAR